MNSKTEKLANKLLNRGLDKLSEKEKRVIESFLNNQPISKDLDKEIFHQRTFGEKLADSVAAFGGSWVFISIFAGALIFWVILNSYVLAKTNDVFDPYPYILLNLFLSMLAAIQAPIIMMPQNRQAARDRLDAAHDYEVNLKAELEIRTIHEKLDELREKNWAQLVEFQQYQIQLLEKILDEKTKS